MSQRKLYILFFTLSLAGYGWLGLNEIGGLAANDSATPCIFKHLTGLPCPSCGTSRSVLLLAQGDMRGALMMNPLGCIAALALIVVPAWIVADTLQRRESFYRQYIRMEQFFLQRKWVSGLAIVMVALNWVWNISKGL